MTKTPKLTKTEQARIDQIKNAKGPTAYKGELGKLFKTGKRVTVGSLFSGKRWM